MIGITEETKINYIWKKLVGKENTSHNKKWYEEEDGTLTTIHKSEIWTDTIPKIPTNENIVKLINLNLTIDSTVADKLAWKAIENNEQLLGWVPPTYGNIYNATLKINGSKIPSSHPCGWYFDYTNGIIHFDKTPPAGDLSLSAYIYVGQTFEQYLNRENDTVAKAIIGINDPQQNYIIQHNMNSFDIDAIIYTWDKVGDVEFWKRDVLPLILLDSNRIQIQLTEPQPVRFIIKSYEPLIDS